MGVQVETANVGSVFIIQIGAQRKCIQSKVNYSQKLSSSQRKT